MNYFALSGIFGANYTGSSVLMNKLFGCHIDATEQQRALNFELVVSDQLFSVILDTYN